MTSNNYERDFKVALLDYINDTYKTNYDAKEHFKIFDNLNQVRSNKRYNLYYAELEAFKTIKKLVKKGKAVDLNNRIHVMFENLNDTIAKYLIESKINDEKIFKAMTL